MEQRFSYDSLDRLETGGEYRGDTSALTYKSKFSYDRFGNRFRKSADNTTGSPTTNWVEDNQIDPATNRFVNSTTSITYDEAGNVTADPKFRGLQYKYDANGRMIWSATASNTQQADAVYDGQGNRVATQVGSVWRYMVYDVGGRMVAEYGGGDPQGAGGVHYQLSDHQGSVRAVMNENGWIAGRRDYQPFGEEVGAGAGQRTVEQGYNAPDISRQKYGMTERDEATGLDHTTWRKYEQNAGRWTSPDPLGGELENAQSFNRYAYSQNDPVNLVDPAGLMPCGPNDIVMWDPAIQQFVCVTPPVEHVQVTPGNSTASDIQNDLSFVLNSRFAGYNTRNLGSVFLRERGNSSAQPTPNKQNAEQQGYENCIRNAARTWRRSEYKAIGKIAGGTLGVLGGLLLTRGAANAEAATARTVAELASLGIRTTGYTARYQLGQAMGLVGSVSSVFTGELVLNGFRDSKQNHALFDKQKADCAQQFPGADHSAWGIMGITAST